MSRDGLSLSNIWETIILETTKKKYWQVFFFFLFFEVNIDDKLGREVWELYSIIFECEHPFWLLRPHELKWYQFGCYTSSILIRHVY